MPPDPLGITVGVTCPFRATTGLPCPFCGGTRAFEHAATLDPDFLNYGAVWVFAAAVALVVVLALLITRVVNRAAYDSARAWIKALPWQLTIGSGIALMLVAWAYALAHRGTIVS